MALLDSIYSAYTGLLSFSKALNVLSNNVANMNTPGFKGSDVTFRDLFYQYSSSGGEQGEQQSQVGEGTDTSGTRIDFAQGQTGNTGNPLDAAISGNGLFVLKDKSNNLYYTRAGQFNVDANGYLVDKTSGYRVQAISKDGALSDIELSKLQTSPAKATSQVTFVGNLSRGATSDQIGSIRVYDSVGGSHTLTVAFSNNSSKTAGSWNVTVTDENSNTVGSGEIRFNSDGSPATGYNTLTVSLTPSGVPASKITLNFGDPGSFSAATNFSGGTTSDLKMNTQDGYAAGSLVTTGFDSQGHITLQYSNGRTNTGPQLALAWFNNMQGLMQSGNELFTNPSGMKPLLNKANGQLTATLTSNEVELSNVDLTKQFTELVIIQRGYQSSSQIVSVANQMIQQLADMRTGGNSSG
jgi:flagellar hook protein FlgE